MDNTNVTNVWHWDDRTRDLIDSIVDSLVRGDDVERILVYRMYYSMKRMFHPKEWRIHIESIDSIRRDKGYKTVAELLALFPPQTINQPVGVPERKEVCMHNDELALRVLGEVAAGLQALSKSVDSLLERAKCQRPPTPDSTKQAAQSTATLYAFPSPKCEAIETPDTPDTPDEPWEIEKPKIVTKPAAKTVKKEAPVADVPTPNVGAIDAVVDIKDIYNKCRISVIELAATDRKAAEKMLLACGGPSLPKIPQVNLPKLLAMLKGE